MESGIKRKLSRDEIGRIMRISLGEQVLHAEELSDGWANAAYWVKLAGGNDVVLKVAREQDARIMRCEKNTMATEVATLKLVGDLLTVPVPQVFFHDDSREVISAEYFIMERLEGKPLNKIKDSLSEDDRQAIEKQLGIYNRMINEIQGSHYGYDSLPDGCRTSWCDAFALMAEHVLADGMDAGVELPASYSEIDRRMRARFDALNDVKEARLIHWDLWDGNVFVEDGRITGLIDFERALWGDPLMEFYFSHFALTRSFEEGYGLSLRTEGQKLRRSLYDLYLDLILYIECPYRLYESQDHIRWTTDNLKRGWERFLAAGG